MSRVGSEASYSYLPPDLSILFKSHSHVCQGKVLVTDRDNSQLSSPQEGVNEIKTPHSAQSDLNVSQQPRKRESKEADGKKYKHIA